jgi:hypothetical protein
MLQFLMTQRLRTVQTAMPVKVVAVHGGGVGPVGTVDVLPLVDQVDGAGNATPHETIYNRPYNRWQGGDNAVILDPVVGDIGLMVFASRDISAVIQSKEHGPPPSWRTFSYADGTYVACMLGSAPTSYVQFLPNGTIKLVSTVAVDIQAPAVNITTTGNVNINGAIISTAGEVTDKLGKVLGTHVHTGVTTGSSDTGPPL